MIWYRYWLEVRSRLPVVAAIALYLGAGTPNWTISGRIAPELLGTGLALSIGRESLLNWIAFSEQMSFFAWIAAFCLMSYSLGINSVSYTLTLPVSRERLIRTQQAGAWIAALGAAALTLAAQCAILFVRGRGIPFVPLAESVAVGAIFLIAWITILGALTMVMRAMWALQASVLGYALSKHWVTSTVTSFPAFGEFPWVSVAALVIISVLALAFSLRQSRIQEFG